MQISVWFFIKSVNREKIKCKIVIIDNDFRFKFNQQN